jgi:plastocyanin domain-containing protein
MIVDTTEIVVVVCGVLLIGSILWFFFGPRELRRAAINPTGLQEIEVVVHGGYSPDQIEVQSGRPVRLNFVRRETTTCTEQVVLPDFGIVRDLPYGKTVAVDFTPTARGEYPFHCAMNMVRGRIVVR